MSYSSIRELFSSSIGHVSKHLSNPIAAHSKHLFNSVKAMDTVHFKQVASLPKLANLHRPFLNRLTSCAASVCDSFENSNHLTVVVCGLGLLLSAGTVGYLVSGRRWSFSSCLATVQADALSSESDEFCALDPYVVYKIGTQLGVVNNDKAVAQFNEMRKRWREEQRATEFDNGECMLASMPVKKVDEASAPKVDEKNNKPKKNKKKAKKSKE